jgi:DNA-binding response OmpR family regulator
MTKQKKILVADDERTARELLGITLANAGYQVVFAEDGLDAVSKASTEKPDLVLMDGLMPKLHGFLACKAIKQLDAPPKVLMITGIYTRLTYKWEVKGEYLADGLLSKPFDRTSLLAAVKTLLPELEYESESGAPADPIGSTLPAEGLASQLETGFTIAPPRLEGRPSRTEAPAV